MFQLCFNFNRIHDSVGKALRTANQARVTVNSHAFSSSFHPSSFDTSYQWPNAIVHTRIQSFLSQDL
jgi:hypothetical protein